MKKTLPLFFFIFFIYKANSQQGYFGLNFDFNSSMRHQTTYAGGLHAEVGLGHDPTWYLNWDFALGANTDADFYGRANILILLYGQPSYWNSMGQNTNSFGELLGYLFTPLLCPVGVSNYFYTSRSGDLRLGFYLNPMQIDYWDSDDPISSWSVHGGFKVLYNWHNDHNFYFKIGGMNIYNTLRYNNSARQDGVFLNFSFGTVIGVDK